MTLASISFSLNTFLIKSTRWLLLGLGVFTVSSVFAWPYLGDYVGKGNRIQVTRSASLGTKTALTAVNTQILGRDKQQRLVEINAEQATPTDKEFSNDPLVVHMTVIAINFC